MLRGANCSRCPCSPLLGMFIMISGNNFLVIYLGLELLTLVELRLRHCAATTPRPRGGP